jgi:hypothetical protein
MKNHPRARRGCFFHSALHKRPANRARNQKAELTDHPQPTTLEKIILPQVGLGIGTAPALELAAAFVRMDNLPFLQQCLMQSGAELQGQFNAFPRFVELNCLADIVHHHLARITARHVTLEFLTNPGSTVPST